MAARLLGPRLQDHLPVFGGASALATRSWDLPLPPSAVNDTLLIPERQTPSLRLTALAARILA
jgi:hypothetical protein